MESLYLKTLLEVERLGSITLAAESMAITQSAASRRIKFLEDQYGQPLLDRSGSTLTLTPAGRVVCERATKILEIEQELHSELHLLDRPRAFSFACTPTFGVVHLPAILREFMLSHTDTGDLRFILDSPEAAVAGLKSGDYQMAVVEHCPCYDIDGFDCMSLAADEMVFAASPRLGLRAPTVDVNELIPFTLFARSECCSRMLLKTNLQNVGKRTEDFRRNVVYADLHVILDALVRGEGVAFISSDLVRPSVVAGTLREYRVSGFRHERKRTLVFADAAPEQGPAAWLVAQILDRFGLPLAQPRADTRSIEAL